MLNGRHLILLGGIAAAGLLSVREGQRQIGVCYQIATVEKEIRGIKSKIQLSKIEHLALQSPKAVTNHANGLRLAVMPENPYGLPLAPLNATPVNPNSRAPLAPRRAAPAAPNIPNLPVLPEATPVLDRTAWR